MWKISKMASASRYEKKIEHVASAHIKQFTIGNEAAHDDAVLKQGNLFELSVVYGTRRILNALSLSTRH